jgi:hypothetical protein
VKVALTGPAAEGAELVAANVGQARWPRWLSPAVLAASLLAALLLWRRGGAPQPRHEKAFGPFPTAAHAQPPASPAPAQPARADLEITAQPVDLETTDQTDPEQTGEWVASPQAATPAIGNPVVPEGAAPEERMDPTRSGRVEISLVRSGSVSLSPRAPGLPPPSIDPKGRDRFQDRRVASLFAEFVKLRRTTGEPIEGLDAAHFVATLRGKRAEIMRQIPVKDVRFKLAFQKRKGSHPLHDRDLERPEVRVRELAGARFHAVAAVPDGREGFVAGRHAVDVHAVDRETSRGSTKLPQFIPEAGSHHLVTGGPGPRSPEIAPTARSIGLLHMPAHGPVPPVMPAAPVVPARPPCPSCRRVRSCQRRPSCRLAPSCQPRRSCRLARSCQPSPSCRLAPPSPSCHLARSCQRRPSCRLAPRSPSCRLAPPSPSSPRFPSCRLAPRSPSSLPSPSCRLAPPGPSSPPSRCCRPDPSFPPSRCSPPRR